MSFKTPESRILDLWLNIYWTVAWRANYKAEMLPLLNIINNHYANGKIKKHLSESDQVTTRMEN